MVELIKSSRTSSFTLKHQLHIFVVKESHMFETAAEADANSTKSVSYLPVIVWKSR